MVDVEALVAQGKADLFSGDREKAIEAFDEAIKADPRCIDAYLYRGAAHQSDVEAIDDFTSAIEACGDEENEQKATAYWWRSCFYDTRAGFIDGPDPDDDGVVTADYHLEVEHLDRSRRDEKEAVRLFWTAHHGSPYPHDEHEFEVPGEIVRTRDLIHEFLARPSHQTAIE